jgi:hypothetical protein
MGRSFKLAWSPELSTFALNSEPLVPLLDRLTRTFLHRDVPRLEP